MEVPGELPSAAVLAAVVYVLTPLTTPFELPALLLSVRTRNFTMPGVRSGSQCGGIGGTRPPRQRVVWSQRHREVHGITSRRSGTGRRRRARHPSDR